MRLEDIVFLSILVALVGCISISDFRSMKIPNSLNALLFISGIGYQIVQGLSAAIAAVLIGSVTLLSFWGLRKGYLITKGVVGLGLGDVKMAGAAATWISPLNVPLMILIASCSALFFVLFQTITDDEKFSQTRRPFGPFLGFGLIVVWLIERQFE